MQPPSGSLQFFSGKDSGLPNAYSLLMPRTDRIAGQGGFRGLHLHENINVFIFVSLKLNSFKHNVTFSFNKLLGKDLLALIAAFFLLEQGKDRISTAHISCRYMNGKMPSSTYTNTKKWMCFRRRHIKNSYRA